MNELLLQLTVIMTRLGLLLAVRCDMIREMGKSVYQLV